MSTVHSRGPHVFNALHVGLKSSTMFCVNQYLNGALAFGISVSLIHIESDDPYAAGRPGTAAEEHSPPSSSCIIHLPYKRIWFVSVFLMSIAFTIQLTRAQCSLRPVPIAHAACRFTPLFSHLGQLIAGGCIGWKTASTATDWARIE